MRKDFQFMGVVNLTPDSFSDGNPNLSSDDVLNKCKLLVKRGARALDFGAESTAPFNQAVGAEEELSRFKALLFPVLSEIIELDILISIDTYRPVVFKEVAKHILKISPDVNLVWNDVSGRIDREGIETLKEFPYIHYVFSHNLVPERELTSKHMDYVAEDLEIENYFKEGLSKLDFHEKIILDPCFGFSKSADQNWELIKGMDKLAGLHPSWLLGVSRKSFFKALCEEVLGAENTLSYTEIPHSLVLGYWSKKLPQGAYFIRLHDVAVGRIALYGQQLLT